MGLVLFAFNMEQRQPIVQTQAIKQKQLVRHSVRTLDLQRALNTIMPVLVLHMDPESESEIRAELKEVSCELNMKIGVAEEGLLIYL